MLWIPDVIISNSIQRYLPMERTREGVKVWSSGQCVHQFSGEITLQCAMDLSMFPFDTQTCSINLESWHLTTHEQTFGRRTDTVLSFIGNITENEEWTIKNVDLNLYDSHYLDTTGNDYAKV